MKQSVQPKKANMTSFVLLVLKGQIDMWLHKRKKTGIQHMYVNSALTY